MKFPLNKLLLKTIEEPIPNFYRDHSAFFNERKNKIVRIASEPDCKNCKEPKCYCLVWSIINNIGFGCVKQFEFTREPQLEDYKNFRKVEFNGKSLRLIDLVDKLKLKKDYLFLETGVKDKSLPAWDNLTNDSTNIVLIDGKYYECIFNRLQNKKVITQNIYILERNSFERMIVPWAYDLRELNTKKDLLELKLKNPPVFELFLES